MLFAFWSAAIRRRFPFVLQASHGNSDRSTKSGDKSPHSKNAPTVRDPRPRKTTTNSPLSEHQRLSKNPKNSPSARHLSLAAR
jgi:hypothetical protein